MLRRNRWNSVQHYLQCPNSVDKLHHFVDLSFLFFRGRGLEFSEDSRFLCGIALPSHACMLGGWRRESCTQGLRYRPVRSNRRGPVPVYRSGLAGNRSKSNLNLKSSMQTVRTGILVGLTGNPPNSNFFSFLV